jgi:hypothetical protein
MWDEPVSTRPRSGEGGRVNRAIDEVARQMTEEAPPAGGDDFRRRVLVRIASDDEPRASWRAAFVLSPVALAAVMVIAVLVMRGGTKPQATPPDTVTNRAEQARPLREPAGTTAGVGGGGVVGAELAPPVTKDLVRRPGPFGPGVSRPAPQLDPIEVDSIAPAALVVGTLAPDPIQIERLDAAAPIDVAPLEIITDLQRRQE